MGWSAHAREGLGGIGRTGRERLLKRVQARQFLATLAQQSVGKILWVTRMLLLAFKWNLKFVTP
jgi:hypothetical protein